MSDICGEAEAIVRLSFTKNGAPMHLYYLPSAPTEQCFFEDAVSVCLSNPLSDPVLVDLLSGEVFSLSPCEECGLAAYKNLPIANYPMVLTERAAIKIDTI
jgi:hypothetical protein